MNRHRVEMWWTTAVYTAVCLDCPWQAEGTHDEVSTAAHEHVRPHLKAVSA